MKEVALKKIEGSANVTAVRIERLCWSTICHRLIAYKNILVLADNLKTEEDDELFLELDKRCAGLSVGEICGAGFHYRAIKKQRRIEMSIRMTARFEGQGAPLSDGKNN
jgi:hypothetical protein